MDLLHTQLQYMVCVRDQEIAALKGEVLIGQMRELSGASKNATFNPGPMTFTEPTPKERPPLDLGSLDA